MALGHVSSRTTNRRHRNFHASPLAIVRLDRREAIREALLWAHPGDTVLVAGKGHERTQTVGTHTFAFDDRAVCRELLQGLGA